MKKQGVPNGKRAAANDRPENGKAEKLPKASKPSEHFKLGVIDKVRRGFLLEFVKFVKAKGTVDEAALVKEFVGRQIDGKKITASRVKRYIGYCKAHGILKANGKAQ